MLFRSRCGVCDTCKSRNELELSKDEFDLILTEVKSLLATGDFDVDQLTKGVNYEESKVISVIRWLLDHNKMETDVMNKLRWKSQ